MLSKRKAYEIIDKILEDQNGLQSPEIQCDYDKLFALFPKEDLVDGIRILVRTINLNDINDSKLMAMLAKECLRLGYFNEWKIREYANQIKFRS